MYIAAERPASNIFNSGVEVNPGSAVLLLDQQASGLYGICPSPALRERSGYGARGAERENRRCRTRAYS